MDIILDGTWRYTLENTCSDPPEKFYAIEWIKEEYARLNRINIPSCMDTIKELMDYKGSIWFFLKLPEMPYLPKSHEYSIEFEGVNYKTHVWINGTQIGSFEGESFLYRLPFKPEMLSLTQDNYLAVRINASCEFNTLPLDLHDWKNSIGIFRTVKLLILAKTRVKKIKINTTIPNADADYALINVEYIVKNPQDFLDRCYAFQMDPQVTYELYYLGRFFTGEQMMNKILIKTDTLDVSPQSLQPLPHVGHDKKALETYFQDAYSSEEVIEEPIDLETYFSNEYTERVTESSTQVVKPKFVSEKSLEELELQNSFQVKIRNPLLWKPNNPVLYQLTLRLHGIDQDKEIRFGIRQISTFKNQIYLNHKPIKLSGICLAEEWIPQGRTYSIERRRKEIIRIKNMGFNAIRLIHGPHDKSVFQIADEEGILLIHDFIINPNWKFTGEISYKIISKLLNRFISRDINHPSLIAWSLGYNIITDNPNLMQAMKICLELAAKWDPTRLRTFSNKRLAYHPLQDAQDLISVELPLQENFGILKYYRYILDMQYYTHPNKPIIVSKFGAEGIYQYQGRNTQITEKYQEKVIYYLMQLLHNHPAIGGYFLWHFRDYRTKRKRKKLITSKNHYGLYDAYDRPKEVVNQIPHIRKQKLYISSSQIIPRIMRFLLEVIDFFNFNKY